MQLQQQSHPPAAVILVDDASTDDSVHTAECAWPGIRMIVLPEPSGVTAARNAGLACVLNQFESDYICFLDNDAFLVPTALAEMVAAASEPDVGMVTPKAFQSMEDRILACGGGMTVNLYLGLFRDAGRGETDLGQYDTPCDVRACPGFAIFVPTRVARRVGLFDTGLKRYGWEDVDYSLRITELGFRLRYAPKAEVEHRGGHAGRGIVASYEYWKLRNLLVLMLRHAGPMQWACFLVIFPLRCLYILLRLLADKAGAPRVLPRLKRLATLIGVQ